MKKKSRIGNFIFSLVIVLALLLSSNFALIGGVANEIKNRAHAAYAPAQHVQPYEFGGTSGWRTSTNAPSGSDLSSAFSASSYNIDLYDNKLDLRPETTYTGEGLEPGDDLKEYVMSIQAKDAPKKVTVDKKDSSNNTVYLKDADGNFLFEPAIYTEEDQAKNPELYEYDDAYKGYKKKIEVETDGEKSYKQDKDGNLLFEPKEYETNGGYTDLYYKVDGSEKYYKKIADKTEEDSYYGFITSSSLPSLKAGNWYVFSFWAWTSGTDATFVVTSGDKMSATMFISREKTENKWVKHYFFFEAASDSSTSVNIAIYFGYEKNITTAEDSRDKISGAVYIDHICVDNISETDYRTMLVTGDDMPADAQTSSYSMRYDYDLEQINGSFQDEDSFTVQDKMYGQEGYVSLESGDSGYQYEKYISRYTGDDGQTDRSESKLAEIRDTYRDYFKFSIVSEYDEFEEDDLNADGDPKKDEEGNVIKKHYNTFTTSNKTLKLENKSEKYDLGLLSSNITIQQLRFYKLSLFLKSKTADEDAVVKLISKINTGNTGEKGSPIIKSQDVTAYTDNSDITNNWTEVTFYIQGNCFADMTMQIAIIACAKSTVYVDNIRLESISSDTYRNQASAKRFDLAPTSATPSSRIENGYFNSISSSVADPSKYEIPYNPYGWSKLENSSSNVVAGIVSTNDTFFNTMEIKDEDDNPTTVKQRLGNPNIPITEKTYLGETFQMPRDNVLAIYSPRKEDMKEEDQSQLDAEWKGHYFGYKSSQFTLSSNSLYVLTFEVYVSNTDKAAFSGSLFANLIYSDEHVAEMTLKEIVVEEWQTYSIVIRTGSTSRTLSLELGVEDAVGTVFFQKVNYKQLTEKDNPDDKDDKITINEQYAEKLEANLTTEKQIENNIRFVDFDGDASVMKSEKKAEGKDYYTSLSHSLKKADDDSDEELIQGELGVVDVTKDVRLSETLTLTQAQLALPGDIKSSTALLIYNDKEYATTVYPNSNSTLSSDGYYEITLWVKTIDVAEGKGLTISMDNVSAEFVNVNTSFGDFKAKDENNGYTKLTALVRTGTSSITGFRIAFSLGTEENKTTGVVIIAGVSLRKVEDEKAYNELLDAVDENDKTTLTRSFVIEDTSTADEDADNLTLATFFLVFSSILLVGALIFAIIAVYYKKSPKRAKANNKDNPTTKEGFV